MYSEDFGIINYLRGIRMINKLFKVIGFVSECLIGISAGLVLGAGIYVGVVTYNVTTSISNDDVHRMFNDIKRAGGAELSRVKLVIVDEPIKNAYVTTVDRDYVVYIYTGLINEMDTEDQVAFILAHELSHITLGHLGSSRQSPPYLGELNADRMATFLMLKAGYNVCAASEYWKKDITKSGINLFVVSHPPNTTRYHDQLFPQCR